MATKLKSARKKKTRPKPPTEVFQIKITLAHSKPPIWRRVAVASDITLAELHAVIQKAMGWWNCHLHEFKIGDRSYGPDYDVDMGFGAEVLDETKASLRDVVRGKGAKFTYQYDFGDDWRHQLVVEQVGPPKEDMRYPTCLAGKRACPPEDCGGVWGYDHFLEAISNPNHEEHEDLLEWVGGEFDPQAFDREAVNSVLRTMA